MKNLKGVYFSVIFIALLLTIGFAGAHEDEFIENIDIHFTPEEAFQNNQAAIEAYIEENSTPLTGLSVFFVVDRHEIGLSERLQAKEREPGRYVIKYEFKNSGPHEVHVEFDYQQTDAQGASISSELIRKTFDIQVEGNENVSYYFIALAAIFLILSAAYYFRSRKGKASIALAIVMLAVTGLSYSVYDVYTTGAAERGVVVCLSDKGEMTPEASGNTCYWSAHIHAEVNIDLCGDTSYRFPVEKGALDGPHTHEERNLIHFHERLRIDENSKEILDTQLLTLGAFFDAMEVPFDNGKVLDKTNGQTCDNQLSTVKMFVNKDWNRNSLGKPVASFRDYAWEDGDVITVIFDERPSEAIAEEQQKTTAALTPELSLPIIVGFALIDSINPCVIGVLLLLISMLLKAKRRRAILVNGSVYTIGVYVTYLIGGVTLLAVFNAVRSIQQISQMFYMIIGIFVLIAAFLEIKDYFWYGRWFNLAIPHRFIKHVESGAKGTHASLISAFLFGSLVTLVELPCTGAPYLAIITLMSQSGVQFASAFLLLLLYNLVFVVPLIVIIYMAYKGIGYKKMEMWRKENRGFMRLVVGLLLLVISVWIITTVLDIFAYLAVAAVLIILGMIVSKKIGGLKMHKTTVHYKHSIKGVIKKNGRKEKFSTDKLLKSLQKSFSSAHSKDGAILEKVANEIVSTLNRKYSNKFVHTDEIKAVTEQVLIRRKLSSVAKHYKLHKYR